MVNRQFFAGALLLILGFQQNRVLGADDDGAAEVAQARQETMDQMKFLGLAMQNYHNEQNLFPPPALVDGDDKPLLSWRVALLPYFEEPVYKELWSSFHLDEAWDSEHNTTLISQMPTIYRCANSRSAEQGKTVYLVPHAMRTAFPGPVGVAIRKVSDGLSNTIGVVEVDDAHAVPWTRPDDLHYDPDSPARGLGGHFDGVFISMFLDGSAHAIPHTINKDTLRALFTISGGEIPMPLD